MKPGEVTCLEEYNQTERQIVQSNTNQQVNMALLCYNKGCGLKFDADKNMDGEILSLSLFVL